MLIRFLILFVFFFASPARAQDDAAHHTQARIFSAVKGVGQSKTVQVGVEIKLEDGWKTYWRTPGEAGLAPVFDWTNSANIKSTNILWPAPHRYIALDIENYGYGGTVTFPVDITLQKPGKPLEVRLKLDLLVCSTLCVPETHRLSLTVPAGEEQVSEDQPLLAEAMQKIPLAGDEESFSVQNLWLEEGDDKKIHLRVNALSSGDFSADADVFFEHPSYITISRPVFSYDSGSRKLRMDALVRTYEKLDALQQNLQKSPVTLTVVNGERVFERRVSVTAKQPAVTDIVIQKVREHINPKILLLAFLGGFILNLMPCVLPVLSLKVLSVVAHGGKDHRIHGKAIFRSFMASAAGIIFSFWLMAGSLIALKEAGHSIGWGIQFQHPGFLIFLIVVLFAFAANMWGLFEIPLPRIFAKNLAVRHEHEPTLLGHFLSGAFATLLATPCTAPFLGTAVGFALAGEAADILIVFTFLGIGLAYPYLILALMPPLFKYMPKPGPWMVTLRRIMATALALTAVWLINVLVTVSTQPTLDNGWIKFDEAMIQPAVDDGKTVVVDVTADWCLTCKANKRLVLEQKDVKAALFVPNVLLLQADWTHRDEKIASYLRKYGRYGIPFNIVYGPGAPSGIILGELLSKKEVMRALAKAADE